MADPGFPRRGDTNPSVWDKNLLFHKILCRKLYENKRNWTGGAFLFSMNSMNCIYLFAHCVVHTIFVVNATTSIVLSEAGCVLGVKSALFHSTHLRHPNPRWWKCFTRAITRTQRTESDLFHKPHLMTNLNVKIYLCSRLKRCCNGNSPHIEIIYFYTAIRTCF